MVATDPENADSASTPPLLAVRGVSKSFPGVRALDDVSLTIHAGEVHALTGENGSGKSTLSKVIGGVIQPDAGHLEIDGVRYSPAAPADALRRGIVMISQELTLAPTLSVAENIYLGRLPRARWGGVDWAAMRRDARTVLDDVGVHVDETAKVGDLSVELQQEIEIARAISSDARLLILDEATSSLSEAAAARLLELVAEQSARGVAILMISHRMPELYACASIATVLRDGALVATVPLSDTPEPELVRLMVGRELGDYYGEREAEVGDVVLETHGLATDDRALRPTSLTVRRGEIVGVAGLVGSGKTELGLALAGAVASQGTVRVNGDQVSLTSPRKALASGIAFVPDDRKRSALLPVRSVAENFGVAWLSGLSRFGLLRIGRERRQVSRAVHSYGVVTSSAANRIAHLSGGNQQKVVLGRVFDLGCDIYVLSEPTRGVDVGAKSDIYRLLHGIVEQGAAVVLISSELPELLGMCDRILVFFEGEIRGEFAREEMDETRIAEVAVSGRPSPSAA
ncbi:sugar ABC transporter ATP-binding protein [Streptosporangium sp. NPDC000509]|uniref:sugar ABC transporter ATP-binding protein n=1 Tax=Streptosporangium sp. NPDC000509 TaxID=3366186 RepID=UPI003674DAF8